MLVNKDSLFVIDEIACFRLIAGDEIIGRVIETTDTTITLKKPRTIVQGPQGLGLGPATIMGSPDSITYFRTAIIAVMRIRSDAEQAYLAHETGISLPQNQGLVVPNATN